MYVHFFLRIKFRKSIKYGSTFNPRWVHTMRHLGDLIKVAKSHRTYLQRNYQNYFYTTCLKQKKIEDRSVPFIFWKKGQNWKFLFRFSHLYSNVTILTRPKEGSYGPYNDLLHDIVTAAKQLAIDRAVREHWAYLFQFLFEYLLTLVRPSTQVPRYLCNIWGPY